MKSFPVVGPILIITIILSLSLFYSKDANAANEYLQGSNGHCSSATLEPYIEYNKSDGAEGNSNSDSYWQKYNRNSDGVRVGFRISIPIGSTCTKEYKALMIKNQQLMQQLEMLKLCARYKGLTLGPEFAQVKEMCAGVSKPPEAEETE